MLLIILTLLEIYDTRVNSSKFIELSNRTLTDFTRCKTNRVLIHDDISDKFSSTGFQENNTLSKNLQRILEII